MELDANKLLEMAVRDGIRDGVKAKLTGYSNPLDKLIEGVIAAKADSFKAMLVDALESCVGDAQFRDDLRSSVRHTLAKNLVSRFGGELEKQVNVLKSDPTTRARITLAIEAIVKEKSES